MKEEVEMSDVMEYCFNEFLKMCEYLNEMVENDRRHFMHLVLLIFKNKIDTTPLSSLQSKEKFQFDQKKGDS